MGHEEWGTLRTPWECSLMPSEYSLLLLAAKSGTQRGQGESEEQRALWAGAQGEQDTHRGMLRSWRAELRCSPSPAQLSQPGRVQVPLRLLGEQKEKGWGIPVRAPSLRIKPWDSLGRWSLHPSVTGTSVDIYVFICVHICINHTHTMTREL